MLYRGDDIGTSFHVVHTTVLDVSLYVGEHRLHPIGNTVQEVKHQRQL